MWTIISVWAVLLWRMEGVYGSVSPSGTGTYYGVNGSVYGGSGYNYGVYGESDQVGVYGDASGNGNGLTWIYGPSYDETAGLYGYASLNNNTNGISYGVVGESFGSSSNNNAGVFGYAANATGTSPRNWGVYGLSKDAVSAAGVLGGRTDPAIVDTVSKATRSAAVTRSESLATRPERQVPIMPVISWGNCMLQRPAPESRLSRSIIPLTRKTNTCSTHLLKAMRC